MTLPPGFLTESSKLDILFLLTAHAGSHLVLAVAGHLTLLILDHFPNHFSADGSISVLMSGFRCSRQRANAQLTCYLEFKTIP